MANEVFTWLSGRELALHVRDLGSNPVGYTFYLFLFFIYFTWNANRPSRRAGLYASAELFVHLTSYDPLRLFAGPESHGETLALYAFKREATM